VHLRPLAPAEWCQRVRRLFVSQVVRGTLCTVRLLPTTVCARCLCHVSVGGTITTLVTGAFMYHLVVSQLREASVTQQCVAPPFGTAVNLAGAAMNSVQNNHHAHGPLTAICLECEWHGVG
jgi:hypothetical protein